MLDKTVKQVKELFALYSNLIKVADRIILDELHPSSNWVIDYKRLRDELDAKKIEIKRK